MTEHRGGRGREGGDGRSSMLRRLLGLGIGVVVLVVLLGIAALVLVVWLVVSAVSVDETVEVDVPSAVEVEPEG